MSHRLLYEQLLSVRSILMAPLFFGILAGESLTGSVSFFADVVTLLKMIRELRVSIDSLLARDEIRLLRKLNTPIKIQDYLDSLPINYEQNGETYMSVRRTLAAQTAHCIEGALVAAAALAYHGERPLLMDLRTTHGDADHVVALFKAHGRWGAISKTNHQVLRYRDPIYDSPRAVALSYFHEYYLDDGRKTLREYSAPFDLSKRPLVEWLTSSEDLIDLVNALDDSRHYKLLAPAQSRSLRRADAFERQQAQYIEWPKP